MLSLVIGATVVLYLWLGGMSFGVNTSCTNAWSCTSSTCPPCWIVSIAGIGGLAVAAVLGAVAILSPWPRRGRGAAYVVSMSAVAVGATLLAQTWSGP